MLLTINESILVKAFRADKLGQIGTIVGASLAQDFDVQNGVVQVVYIFEILWPDGTLGNHRHSEFVVLDDEENPDAVWDWLQQEMKNSRGKI